jgi:hypothetical protein
MMRLWRSGLVRAAGVTFGLALSALGWTVWGAVRIAPTLPDGAVPGSAAEAAPLPQRRAAYPVDRLVAAVAKDPFHPERRRPGRRFELPSDLAGRAARAARPRPVGGSVAVRLIGVAVDPAGGGSAICQSGGSAARLVRVGERVGDWTLKRVLPGAAEFATPAGGTVTLRVPKAGT